VCVRPSPLLSPRLVRPLVPRQDGKLVNSRRPRPLLRSLNLSQFAAHKHWRWRCASPHRFRATSRIRAIGAYPTLPLVVHSKTLGKARLHPTVAGQRARDVVRRQTLLCSWKFDGPDCTNRVWHGGVCRGAAARRARHARACTRPPRMLQ
jgi:hypothetical protein